MKKFMPSLTSWAVFVTTTKRAILAGQWPCFTGNTFETGA
jgi:hypothetical protein